MLESVIVAALIFLAGMALGAAVTAAVTYRKPSGTVFVVTDKDDGQKYMFLELEDGVDIFTEKKEALFKIARK